MQSYSVLAEYYDRLTQNDCDYKRWSQYLYSAITSVGGKNGVDLACGTGKMTKLLCAAGLGVIGIDSSPEMLAEASQNVRAPLVLQDIRKFKLTRKADFAVCVNDGINYIKQDELPVFFRTVNANLREGGIFIFDVSSEYKLKEKIGNNVFYVDEEDVTLLWDNVCSNDKVEMFVTLFQKSGDVYVRRDEKHVQYVHKRESIADALSAAGFSCEVTDDYGKKAANETTSRLTFSAVKFME